MNPVIRVKVLDRVRVHPLFSSLKDEDLVQLFERARPIDLVAHEKLFSQGEKADRFFIVVSGSVKLFRFSKDGQEKVIEVIEEGHSMAEAIMFMEDLSCYPVNAEALEKTTVVGFNSSLYLQILESSPQSCFKILGTLSRRLHTRLNEIETLTLKNARHRACRYLLDLAGKDALSGQEIHLPVAKQLIAARLAMQPETLSRILRELIKEEIIIVNGRDVTINNLERLKAVD
ncbi:Crp/Fnr family transcriptional regulator [Neptunomonas japonica]|uniref:Crp/Fnr family transcriptional regulator n=1 Tax=Neptunomonas japonica TaxID=417574 RepID=UPI00041DCD30|nr:Crp/Fnr family transcriptional regulator [Neptunomonas japonica]